MEKIVEEPTTVAGDVNLGTGGGLNKVVVKRNKKEKEKDKKEKKMEIIKENDNYKLYNDNEKIVFEFLHRNDIELFQKGYKQNNPRFWRQSETTRDFMDAMNGNKTRNFVVRYGNDEYKPNKGF